MPSKSKTKGSSWERDVSKILAEIYDDSFIRVPSSGAFVGGMNVARKANMTEGQIQGFKGDIIPPDDWKYFNCECKNYADLRFHHLITDKDIPLLDEWIEQTLTAGAKDDFNIMFIKITRKGTYVAFQSLLTKHLQFNRHVLYKDWIITDMDTFLSDNASSIKSLSINGVNKHVRDLHDTAKIWG